MITIWQPRWRDRRVLIARYRIPTGCDFNIKITQGAAKGIYRISNELVCKSPIESIKTKNGKTIQVRSIPLDELERIENE